MRIQIKRVYETRSSKDGFRVLVDRLWPRGLTKDKAKIDLWAKDLAPSSELRKWYGHDPHKWGEFKRRYFGELKNKKPAVSEFVDRIRRGSVTFLFSSKEQRLNNAHALKEFLAKL